MPWTIEDAEPTGYVIEDAPETTRLKKQLSEPMTWAEKNIAPLAESLGLDKLFGGNLRGSGVGRAMMGAADPGAAIFQLGANLVGQGDAVNKGIAETEAQYQAARNQTGSTGFDPLRLAGNIAITAPASFIGAPAATALGAVGKGALQGAAFSALEPVTQGDFLKEKAKQVAMGAVAGGVTAPLVHGLSKIVSPVASVNPQLQQLQSEGVQPSIGQTLGGAFNRAEEKLQSVPIFGDAIRSARTKPAQQLESAAFARAADPIGVTIKGRGNEGIAELETALSKEYDKVIPKLSVDALDPAFVAKMSNLRSMAQSLPATEAQQFDNIIAREVDARLAPNGVLSGQNLKDAWRSLREIGSKFSKSDDPYQSQLGQAVKQAFQELKDHVTNTNPQVITEQLRNADLGYANFKRLQRAAGAIGAEEGRFSPAQLQSAVKALDSSKDKAAFARGDALMQDLSGAGKSVITNKVPDSGTAGRLAMGAGALASGAISPAIPAALIAGAGVYSPPIQNALRALIMQRPDLAPKVANELRRLAGPGAALAGLASGR